MKERLSEELRHASGGIPLEPDLPGVIERGERISARRRAGALIVGLGAFALTLSLLVIVAHGASERRSSPTSFGALPTGALRIPGSAQLPEGALLFQNGLQVDLLPHGSAQALLVGKGMTALELSPDGQLVLTESTLSEPTSFTRNVNLDSVDTSTGDLTVLAQAGATQSLADAQWSPSGDKVAYVTDSFSVDPSVVNPGPTPSSEVLCIVSVPPTNPTCYPQIGSVSSFSWAPNGAEILTTGSSDREVRILSLTSAETSTLIPVGGDASLNQALKSAGMGSILSIPQVSWSPDGRYAAAFVLADPGGSVPVIVSTSDGAVVAVGKQNPDTQFGAWSPSGNLFAYTTGLNGVGPSSADWTVRTLTPAGQDREAFRTQNLTSPQISGVVWSPSGTLLAIDNIDQIRIVDMATGTLAYDLPLATSQDDSQPLVSWR